MITFFEKYKINKYARLRETYVKIVSLTRPTSWLHQRGHGRVDFLYSNFEIQF